MVAPETWLVLISIQIKRTKQSGKFINSALNEKRATLMGRPFF
jgi:hypothetical protein